MPEPSVRTPGAPTWVDLSSNDLEASRSFYGKLFGWEAQTTPEPEAGGYTMFTLKGREVAGLGPTQTPDQPAAWMIYLGTDDADATARAVQEAGGTVVAAPFDVLKAGRMAVFQDPSGAFFSVWQAGEHKGYEVVEEPGAFAWTELNARGVDAARAFYRRVFGWGEKTSPMGEGQPEYTELQLGGRSIGGATEMNPQVPAQVPSHWMNYFAVADVDRSAEAATGLGARIMMPPTDFPGGRFAIVQDPQGATFGLLRLSG